MPKIKPRVDEYRPDARLIDERGPTKERLGKLRPSPINMALEAEKITREQALAAEKFYKHWHSGGMVGHMPSVELDRVFGGDGFGLMPRSENEAFHRDRYRKARALIEKELGAISLWVTEQVVCHEKPFTEVGAIFGHKNRTRAAQVSFNMLVPTLNLLCGEWGIG